MNSETTFAGDLVTCVSQWYHLHSWLGVDFEGSANPHVVTFFNIFFDSTGKLVSCRRFVSKPSFRASSSILSSLSSGRPRSGELRTQKLKSHPVGTQNLNVLPLKPGVGHYIAIHATLTAKDFLLVYFYPSGPFICIFSKPSPNFFVPV